MRIITGSTLERIRFSCLGWGSIHNDNIQRLEDNLLKVSGLYDVQLTSLTDGDVLEWDAGISKWINVDSSFMTSTTTTTTTTT